ncbi:5'-nucleotidase domain-containing protein 1 [Anabrus simplex]|uniref:5'-nucleotidase domain-containing protein 1 n=1 Tax=Anabrus simplex TaxID=316456 RepID=UPI0035A28673
MAKFSSLNVGDAKVFRLSDYDCVGFDLDNTICRYKLSSMVKMEYEVIADYLVREKGYNPEYLLKPFEANLDFVKKGLLLDFARGNVVQIRFDGYIAKASHGTRFLSEKEIIEVYGPNRKWDVAEKFTQNMLEAWNGPLSEKVRTLLDYFDMPASLAFARAVDSVDAAAEGKSVETYTVWPDVHDALLYMFKRERFSLNEGGYFPALKSDPDQYIIKCSNNVLSWLRLLKSKKVTFLITGSHVDFASFTATHCMGEDWRNLFDVVVCYARKPGFFTGVRPFIALDGFEERDSITAADMKPGNIYSQGNWQDLQQFLKMATKEETPKCLYVGDNLIQDIYTPSEYTRCDTVSVVEELSAEGMVGSHKKHSDSQILVSDTWGSYFCCGGKGSFDANCTLWSKIIQNHSQICVPDLECLANHNLDHCYSPFVVEEDSCKQMGYYPSCPASLAVLL